ncbi:MAG: hypothetical protein JSU73_08275 [candidate division WOR-3 bacterium]|jgi:hypothetical protein|nr:MAG: hypothetical protein JSU73_08275 [candidate division WOR-3 bacterium]
MKIDGKDFIDWLHEQRAAAEEKRKAEGVAGADRLAAMREMAARVLEEVKAKRPPVAREK